MTHRVAVRGVPPWVDAKRLLGAGFAAADGVWAADLPTAEAADVQARLRGIGLGGRPIAVSVSPALPRAAVRAARTRDARARRDTTPGFTRPGVRLDAEGRWSLTPEVLALWMGRRARGRDVVDIGCGVGGNAIGFARAGCRVTAFERDPIRAAMARHNARVYGVAARVTVHRADARDVLSTRTGDLLFVDPPWGTGWNRIRTGVADLPLLTEALAAVRSGRFAELWAKVPPSFDPSEIPGIGAVAVFGRASGDRHRVKFVWLRWLPPDAATPSGAEDPRRSPLPTRPETR